MIRFLSADTFGRLAHLSADSRFVTELVALTVDKYEPLTTELTLFMYTYYSTEHFVKRSFGTHPNCFLFRLQTSREVATRTAFSVALGAIHRHVGSLGSAQQHLSRSVSLLLALARDLRFLLTLYTHTSPSGLLFD